ncbi:hypothetical protein FPV67DRAFT_1412017, partial [Lyophyllum atratum]
ITRKNLQSPFMDRLKTDYHATDAEVPKIRQIVSDALEKRQRIEDRISRFSALIDDLHLQRKAMDEHIRDHRTLISGIRKLPVEVMQTIFCWCLPSRNCAMSSGEPPLLLGRVCSTWRQISFSTPQLWSSLHVAPPYGHGRDKSDLLVRYGEAIEAWLSRSASLPISISFVDDQHPPYSGRPVSTDSSHYLLDIIFRYSRRWKHLNSRILHDYMGFLTRLTENDVPVLETVQLEVVNARPEAHFPSLSFFHSASIRKLFFFDYPSQASSTLPVRWEVLTSLHMISRGPYNNSRLTINDTLNILNKCPRLVIFVCEVSSHGAGIVSTHAIGLPHLQEFRVKLITSWEIHEEQIRRFFGSLDLPQLRHIELTEMSYIRRPPFIPLLSPRSSIDTMAIDIAASTVDDLSECLHMTPFLKRLYLNCSDPAEALPSLSTAFISRLHPASSMTETTLCPFLEEVELLFPPSTDVTDDDILQFILSRTTLAPEGVVHLRRASFTFRRYLQRDIYPDLAPVLHMGFKLHLKYDQPPVSTSNNMPMPIFTPFKNISISDDLQYDAWQPRSWVKPSAWGP